MPTAFALFRRKDDAVDAIRLETEDPHCREGSGHDARRSAVARDTQLGDDAFGRDPRNLVVTELREDEAVVVGGRDRLQGVAGRCIEREVAGRSYLSDPLTKAL